MQLEEFFDYKNQLLDDILTDPEIVHLINDSVDIEDAASLVYKQVFPCEYIPETIQKGETYVCCDVDIQRVMGKPLYMPTIYIWVFAHRSNLRLPDGGLRVDKLCSKICKKINGSFKYGVGALQFYSSKRFAIVTDYQGKCLTFRAEDFALQFDPNKEIPSNRKRVSA